MVNTLSVWLTSGKKYALYWLFDPLPVCFVTLQLAYEKQIAFLKHQAETNQPSKISSITFAETESSSVVKARESTSSESVNHGGPLQNGQPERGTEMKLCLEVESVKQENGQLKEKVI